MNMVAAGHDICSPLSLLPAESKEISQDSHSPCTDMHQQALQAQVLQIISHALLSHRARVAGLRGKLPDHIKLPPSVTVPFGAFEEALGSKDNADMKQRLEAAIKDIPQAHAEEQLRKCHDIAMEVIFSPSHSVSDPRTARFVLCLGAVLVWACLLDPALSAYYSAQLYSGHWETCTCICWPCISREDAHPVLLVQVKTPAKLEEELKAAMKTAGIPVPDTPERWQQALKALKVTTLTGAALQAVLCSPLPAAKMRLRRRLSRCKPRRQLLCMHVNASRSA